MGALFAGFATIGGFVFCCGALFVLILCALVVWYWKHQPEQEVSDTAPEPPIQTTIEHPTAAAPAVTAQPEPMVPESPAAPEDTAPPSADA